MAQDKIDNILQERGKDYGDFKTVADRYTKLKLILNRTIPIVDICKHHEFSTAQCLSLVADMLAVKIARLMHSEKQDTIDDIRGYLRLAIANAEMETLSQVQSELRNEIMQLEINSIPTNRDVQFKDYLKRLDTMFSEELEKCNK